LSWSGGSLCSSHYNTIQPALAQLKTHTTEPTIPNLLYMQYCSRTVFIVYFSCKRCRWLIYCLLCHVTAAALACKQPEHNRRQISARESHTHTQQDQGVTPAPDLNALPLTTENRRRRYTMVRIQRHLPLRLPPTFHSREMKKRRRHKMCF